jgi:4-hydroxybenzoate polyprenyltransferase
VSGVQSAGIGATASVLGTQFVPAQGAAGHAARVALAATGLASGVYLVFAAGLILIGIAMRWAAAREARR